MILKRARALSQGWFLTVSHLYGNAPVPFQGDHVRTWLAIDSPFIFACNENNYSLDCKDYTFTYLAIHFYVQLSIRIAFNVRLGMYP